MLFDVSASSPIILQAIIGILLLVGLVRGLRDGIIVMILRVALYAGLGYGVYVYAPTVGTIIANTGFLEGILSSLGDNPITNMLSSIIGDAFYKILAAVLMVIVGLIVIKIILFMLRTVFKKKGFIVRLIGGIVSLTVSFVFAAVILICISSPLLFNGGLAWINNSAGVKEVYQIVTILQTQLRNNGIPSTLEEAATILVLGGEATPEDLLRYNETFGRIELLMDDPEAYAQQFLNEDFTFNEENIDILVNDLIVFSEIISCIPTADTTIVPSIETMVNDLLVNVPEGATVEIPSDLYASLTAAISNAGFSSEFQSNIISMIIQQA